MPGDMTLFLLGLILIPAALLAVGAVVDLVTWARERRRNPPVKWQPVRRKAVEGGKKSVWDEVLESIERRNAI